MISQFKGIFFRASLVKSPNFPSILPLPFLKAFSASQIPATKMESESPARNLLLLAGKSNEENDVAKVLKNNNTLQLHKIGEQVEVVLHSQVETPLQDDAFRVEEYFNSLSTTRYGRLLIYSPKLSSTHDVISQNNSELPVGTVCVADVQLKGRGVGLNVGNEKPTTCLNAVLNRVNPLSRELKREDIIAAFFNKFESFYDIFLEQGFQALEELYYRTWLHSGQRVIVQERSDDQDELVENVVTIQGLASSGYLLGITDDGQMCELHPDGNSFDFFKGLIKRKMS